MKRGMMLWTIALAVVCIGMNPSRANATWPADGVRTISGKACHRFSANNWSCPFTADSNYSYEDNAGIYVDYHVSTIPVGAHTVVSACHLSYTGGSVECANDGASDSVTNAGVKNLSLHGFGYYFVGSVWDYYYIQILGDNNAVIDQVYGVSFFAGSGR